MKTLSVREAAASLERWVALAAAGERIQIRNGDAVVELGPAPTAQPATEPLTPREALRLLQEDARLTPLDAERYLQEVGQERLASESQRPG